MKPFKLKRKARPIPKADKGRAVDIRKMAVPRYKLRHEFRKDLRSYDPWNTIVPGKYGDVFVWGSDRLAFAGKRRGPIARKVAALEKARVEQDGDDGQNISFPAKLFWKVAQIIKAYRRPQLTDEQRAAKAEQLKRNLGKPMK